MVEIRSATRWQYYERVAEAAAEGLGLIAHVTMHPDVINDTSGYVRDNSMAAIPEAELRQHVRDVMDFTLNDPLANATVSAWYTLPEELRSWRTTEMNYLNIVADEVKNYDPLGRPVSMYNPNHRTERPVGDHRQPGARYHDDGRLRHPRALRHARRRG